MNLSHYIALASILCMTHLGAMATQVTESVISTTQSIQDIDKVELHLHLGGSWPIDFLKTLATPDQFNQLNQYLDQIERGINYHDAFKVFGLVAKLVDTDQKVQDGVAALCKQLAAENVTYAEIRTGLKDLGSGFEGYLQAILRGIAEGTAQTRLKVDILLSLRRDSSEATAEQTIALAQQYRGRGVVGIDVSGDSIQGDGSAILQALENARANGLPVALHLGESPQETAQQQMKELETLKPQRIGHGVHLCPEAIAWIKNNNTPIELCLTSAVKVGMIEHAAQHPALKLLASSHPVVVCTDDPLIFRTTLWHECQQVATLNGLSVQDINKLQELALTYRFT